MPDLIVYLPNNPYAADDSLYVSWLDVIAYVSDVVGDSFKLATTSGGSVLYQFTESITSGFVREDTGTPGATISGLDHLEGELVYVVSQGVFIGAFTVASGEITTPSTLTTYQIGLQYSAKIRTMRLEIPTAPTNQSRIKRINETVLRAFRTKNGQAGQEYGGIEYLDNLRFDYSNESSDRTIPTEGGFTEDAYTVIRSNDPFPAQVIATIVSVTIEETR